MKTDPTQRRVVTVNRDKVINGARHDGVYVGPPRRPTTARIVCHGCGKMGGTLVKKDVYYCHPGCTPSGTVS